VYVKGGHELAFTVMNLVFGPSNPYPNNRPRRTHVGKSEQVSFESSLDGQD